MSIVFQQAARRSRALRDRVLILLASVPGAALPESLAPGYIYIAPLGICVKLSQSVPHFWVILTLSLVVATITGEGFVQARVFASIEQERPQDTNETGRTF